MSVASENGALRRRRGLGARFRTLFEVARRVVTLLRYSSPRLSVAVSVLTLLETIFGLAALYLLKLLLDIMSEELADGAGVAQQGRLFLYLALTAGATLISVAMQAAANYTRIAQGMHVADYIDREIHKRAIEVDLAFYESPRYFDSLQRARAAGTQRPAQVVSGVFLLLKSTIFLVATLLLMAGIDWRLVPTIFLPVLLVLLVQLRFSRVLFDWRKRRTQMERRAQYLDFLLTSDHHAKELRLGGLGPYLSDAYSSLRKTIRGEELQIEGRKSFAEAFSASAGAIVFVGTTGFLVFRTLQGAVTIGDLVLFVLLFRRAEVSGKQFVGQLARLYDDQLYLRQLFAFLDVKPRLTQRAITDAVPFANGGDLKFENVSFRYPGSERQTLSDIDLEVPQGQIVALVGENGSGKTSLIKLIGRLYDPDEGRITLGGTDVRDFDPEVYRRHFSVIFQDYATYAATAAENVRFGDIDNPLDEDRLKRAAREADAEGFVSKLRQGWDTPLSRMFDDGEEISIGQWQRLALARAFYPPTDFIIMDEPTSALDPKAEFELFQNFRDRIEGRSALVISHRLSTIRQADYIYVLSHGRIVERGTHDELIAARGHYEKLFEKQGRNYR